MLVKQNHKPVLISLLLLSSILISASAAGPTRAKQRNRRFVVGGDIDLHKFPFMAQILKKGLVHCSGTVLDNRHVLTLADCVLDDNATVLPTEQVMVHVGHRLAHLRETSEDIPYGRYEIEHINVSEETITLQNDALVRMVVDEQPSLRNVQFLLDKFCMKLGKVFGYPICGLHKDPPDHPKPMIIKTLAILRTKQKIRFDHDLATGLIETINLPSAGQELKPGELLVAAGFGARNALRPWLHTVNLNYVDYGVCEQLLQAAKQDLFLRRDFNLCAGYKPHASLRNGTCGIDTGGPLIRHANRINDSYGPELVGVALYQGDECVDVRYPDVFVRIVPYLNWIREHTQLGQ